MSIIKKSLVLVFLIVFSSIVIAESRDLDVCVDTCKSNFEDETDRSPCIMGCKDKYGFDDMDPKMENCQDECKTLYKDDKETKGDCIKKCKAEFGVIEVDPDFDDCNDHCNDFWMSAMPACPGEQDTTGVFPDCECGWKCYDEEDKKEEIFKGYENEKFERKAGTMPGSPFYFIDKFFDRFGDEIAVKEERIAEIKAMVDAGDLESAKAILKDYMELAEELEDEVDPDRKEDVKRSAAAIRNAMKDIRDKLPPGERGEFVSEIMKKEHSIATSAEISYKIKELCEELSELDPLEYSRVCKTEDDSPKWQKKLDKKLTQKQVNEAKKFGKIMKSCFDSSGRDCDCDSIPFPDFANACSRAAPLAMACEEGDENACNKLDNLEMPRLPPHLQEVMDKLEGGDVMESKFELHMPPECKGVKSPKECKKIMIKKHAPEECREALLEADVESEAESRRICDKIMMKKHAPECFEKEIMDPDECARYMDKLGEERKEGPRIDFDCRGIDDPGERLECYDKAASQAKGYKGFDDEDYEGPCMTEKDWKREKAKCREMYGDSAGDKPKMGDSGQGYECAISIECIDFRQPDDNCLTDEEWQIKKAECRGEYGEGAGDEPIMGDSGHGYRCPVDIKCLDKGPKCGDCEKQCTIEGKLPTRTDCVNNECKCYYDYSGPGCGDCASECEEVPGKLLSGTNCINNKCECYYRTESECKDGCSQECGDQATDCVNDKCVCLGYGDGGDYIDECDQCSSKCEGKRWDCISGRCKCFDDYGGGDDVDECDQCSSKCGDRGWDCSNGKCLCHEHFDDDYVDECGECSSKCGDKRWDCTGGRCKCFDDYDDSSGSGDGGDDTGSGDGEDNTGDDGSGDDGSDNTGGDDTGSDGSVEQPSPPDAGDGGGGDDTGGADSGGSDDGGDNSGDSGSNDDTKGMGDITGNAFVDYWYG